MKPSIAAARDGEEFVVHSGGQEWTGSWHPPTATPEGKRHGSAAVCVTPEGEVILVSQDGEGWELPGGRPEAEEDWRETLDREVLEEACAVVERARLLGFARSECIRGHEKGLVLVRALWRAEVTVRKWEPQHEMRFREVVSAEEARGRVTMGEGNQGIYQRWFAEALGG